MTEIRISLDGDLWKSAPRSLRRSSSRLETWSEKTVKRMTKDLRNEMVRGILREGGGYRYRFRKLSPAYAQRKRSEGLFEYQVAATKEYVRNIVVDEGRNAAAITVRPGKHSRAKLSYAQLANYIENGTRTMDRLPHWRPIARKAKKEIKRRFGRMPRGIVSFS